MLILDCIYINWWFLEWGFWISSNISIIWEFDGNVIFEIYFKFNELEMRSGV